MDINEEIKRNKSRHRQILIDKDSPYLKRLRMIIDTKNHKSLITWGLALASESIAIYETKYQSGIAQYAYDLTCLWASGEIKMPRAKKAILDCHALAKSLDDKADIALVHAIGQALSIVHTRGHSLGYPIYDLTYQILKNDTKDIKPILDRRMDHYIGLFDQLVIDNRWASFIV